MPSSNSSDIFDVWFESGSSWRSVLDRPDHRFPADLYMEAQDQHRGWFQTSLLPAMATRGQSPFRECVTHGFFTDDAGDKVSKSKGGMAELSARVLTQQIGADITRLFFASANYFEDIAISRRLMEPTGDQYRKVRNTLRFLLGAVNGYDAAMDAVPPAEMLAIDRWVVAATDDVASRVDAACMEHGLPTEIGEGEGELTVLAWPGYAEDGSTDPAIDWITPFEEETGCNTTVQVFGTSDEAFTLFQQNPEQFDVISASGDASLRLVAGGFVQPVNVDFIPSYAEIFEHLKNKDYNTVDGVNYGVPHGRGANVLMWRTDEVTPAPTSWSEMFDPNSPYAGKFSVYDAPIYIADAAVDLMTEQQAVRFERYLKSGSGRGFAKRHFGI